MDQSIYSKTRDLFSEWQINLAKDLFSANDELAHTFSFYLAENFQKLQPQLLAFGSRVAGELEALVNTNNEDENLPHLKTYTAFGDEVDEIIHHPSYTESGDIIYGTGLLEKLLKPGNLAECLAFLFLSAHAGEAGHNCPIACSAGLIRILNTVEDFPEKKFYLQKLVAKRFSENFTGAQFVTEIQGGSDVGQNATRATQDASGIWHIEGEKWFCSNANADLFLIMTRIDPKSEGTQGLGLFLVPAKLEEKHNHFRIKRLKRKLGTRSMATAEIDFLGAEAILMGTRDNGIHLLMEHVLHVSRIFNCFAVLGMGRRAFQIAHSYAGMRVAFGHEIIDYPLVQEKLATMKAENAALLAAAFAAVKLQDDVDSQHNKDQTNKAHNNKDHDAKLLLRLLVNLNKHFTAFYSVRHVHSAIDVLAGNGTIESFSTLPRVLRDCIVCENWEGTHFTLWMQILRDIEKFNQDQLFLDYVEKELSALSRIKEVEKFKSQLKVQINVLAEQLKAVRVVSVKEKTLLMKFIVNLMARIFCSLSLLKEAIHMQETKKSDSKFMVLEYFNNVHFEDASLRCGKEYLKLMERVVGVFP